MRKGDTKRDVALLNVGDRRVDLKRLGNDDATLRREIAA